MTTTSDSINQSNFSSADTDKFISIWLATDTPKYTKFTHRPLQERTIQRDNIQSAIGRVVFSYHNDPQKYREQVKAIGFPEIAKELDHRPLTATTRLGNFGEIIASEYLRQEFGFDIPIFRLRYNPNKNQSMKGDDILAFNFGLPDGSGKALVVGESKVRSACDKEAVKDAYVQLVEACKRPHPISLTFVSRVLALEGKLDKSNAVLSFLDYITHGPPKKIFVLFLMTGNKPRDPFEAIEGEASVVSNLLAVNLAVKDLSSLVKQAFEYKINPNEPD